VVDSRGASFMENQDLNIATSKGSLFKASKGRNQAKSFYQD
jgi:hypothetical protein